MLPSSIQRYKDPRVAQLRQELARLEQELAQWERQKAELEQQLHALSVYYRLELGPLLQEFLHLRLGQAPSETDPALAGPEMPLDEVDEEALPAQVGPGSNLSPAEQKELKDLFRQASKRCHPDAVTEEFRDKARSIFIELKSAYERNDLEQVREIWQILKQSNFSDVQLSTKGELTYLWAMIRYLHARIQTIRDEVDHLKSSATYHRLTTIDDWDEYFDELKANLQRRINRLRQRNGR